MKPLIPQTVFIETGNEMGFYLRHPIQDKFLEEKTDQYIFTKEELEEILKKAFQAGNERGWSGYPNTDNHTKPTKEQFINNLLKQQ